MALVTTSRGRAGLSARLGSGPDVVGSAVLAAGLAVLATVLGWQGADAPNYLFRIELFRQAGLTVWNMAWYGGHYTIGYSALLPPLGALLGPAVLNVAAAAVASICFVRLLPVAAISPGRRRAAALLFAAGTVTNVAVGRLAFALGLAIGLAAVVAGGRGRSRLAAVLSLATTLASPVAGAFLALAWVAAAVADLGRPRRSLMAPMVYSALALAPIAVTALVFPEGGTFPFRWTSLLVVLAACALALALVPRSHRAVRVGAALYAGAAVATFVLATPLGANLARLGMYLAAPILVAVVPRRRMAMVALALPLLLWWQWSPAFDGMLRAGADPSSDAAYHQPLIDFLDQQPRVVGRIEIPLTEHHFEAAYVATAVPLARGWERQLDIADNPLFYEPGLDAVRYRAWLVDNGIDFVALPDVPLDPSAEAEVAIVTGNPSYLQPVWHSDHWRVWRVVGSPGLVSGPARLAARDADHLTVDATGPGVVLVRVHWTAFWSLTGSGCVAPSSDGWTRIQVSAPSHLVLEPKLFGPAQQCAG
jgi:hypothetical protein